MVFRWYWYHAWHDTRQSRFAHAEPLLSRNLRVNGLLKNLVTNSGRETEICYSWITSIRRSWWIIFCGAIGQRLLMHHSLTAMSIWITEPSELQQSSASMWSMLQIPLETEHEFRSRRHATCFSFVQDSEFGEHGGDQDDFTIRRGQRKLKSEDVEHHDLYHAAAPISLVLAELLVLLSVSFSPFFLSFLSLESFLRLFISHCWSPGTPS